ncbi:MAG TPA: RtcB family protein [Methanoculleus sp.]|mgnify:CR=1 FL=1|nr:RtcB family protein [Methanoculleus sp.]
MLESLRKLGGVEWEIPIGYTPNMNVPGKFFLSDRLAAEVEEGAIQQLANVATMPGIVNYALAMPDIHWGYGFPIGGVAAFSPDHGVVSPGGVGFDINCGVRLIATPLREDEFDNRRELIERLFRAVPTGVGARSPMKLAVSELKQLLVEGASWAVEHGFGMDADLLHCEQEGRMEEADIAHVSEKALQRGIPQCGTLGSGNHFLEIQVAREIVDRDAAAAYGIAEGQICMMIHCGSRGLGHQVCTDHLKVLEQATKRYGIDLPDRQLACAPLHSSEGEAYFSAMAAAANYAWANRQMIMHTARTVVADLYGVDYGEMHLVYDVAHNVAKFEEHLVDGRRVELCVHRKGATRAFGPDRPEVPQAYRATGQPVIIPGSMGTSSYLLKGTEIAMEKSFGSTCHGAGRVLSRSRAKKQYRGSTLKKELEQRHIVVRAASDAVIAEEAPGAYKPSDEVVRVVDAAGLSRVVARLEPLGVIKG